MESSLKSSPLRSVSRYALTNRLLPPAITLALVAVGMFAQFSQPLNADLAWLLVAAERFVDGGAVHGRDLFELDQPMMLWLLAPGVLLSRLVDQPSLDAMAWTRLYLSCFGLFGLWFFWRIGRRALLSPHPLVPRYLLALLAYALFIHPGRDFGQQEHVVAFLMLPNILLVAAHAGKRRVGRRVALFTGMATGMAICVKPPLILVALVWEVYLLFRRRRIAYWWRADVAGMALVGGIYVASLLVMTPAYVGIVIPIAVDTFWVYQMPVSEIVLSRDIALLAGSLISIPLVCIGAPYYVVSDEYQEEVEREGDDRHQRRDLLEFVLASILTALALYLVGLAQATGWRHHMLPYQLALILAYGAAVVHGLAWLVARIERDQDRGDATGLQEVVALALAAAFALLYVLSPSAAGVAIRTGEVWRRGGTSGEIEALTEFITERADGAAVYAMSTRLDVLFPAINHAEVGWTSRFPTLYLPAVVVRFEAEDPMSPAHLTAARVQEIERLFRDAVLEDMERRPPALVLVDTAPDLRVFAGRDFDYLDFLLDGSEFEERWAGFEEAGRIGRFDAFVRRRD